MRTNSTPERFRNRKEALLWLQSRGQISQGKFYQDCAAGLLVIYPDKSLSKFQVAEYAEKVFGFARQEPPQKPAQRINRRTSLTCAGLLGAGQGLPMGEDGKGAETMDYTTGIENVDVVMKLAPLHFTNSEKEPGKGSIDIAAALTFTFTGNLKVMAAALRDIPQDQINGVITGALAGLLGEGIRKGDCHVKS